MADVETAPPRVSGLANVQSHSRDVVLVFCRLLNAITSLSLVLCATAFAMAIFLQADAPNKDLLFYSGQLVRIFGIAWSLSLILVESEWRLILRAAPLLDLWIGRGVAQTFMAILTYREAFPNEEVSHMQKSLQLYRAIASASLAGCACVHLLGGMVCMGTIRKARQRREDRLLAAATEFDELERRRRELQVLLGRGSEL